MIKNGETFSKSSSNGGLQCEMHRDFFERCKIAIEQGFYMEAILMEYAAIEARMEILLGVIGLPCNKFLPDADRKKVQLSHRIKCADSFRRQMRIFDKTKLSKSFFENLLKWTKKRNEYIHGLYKSELKYSGRIKDAKAFSEKGLEYCRLLYNEVNRVKRLAKSHQNLFAEKINCKSGECQIREKQNVNF